MLSRLFLVLVGLLVFGGSVMAKDSNTNSVSQQTTASPSPPTLARPTNITHANTVARLPITAPRVGPNTTGVVSPTGFDEALNR